MRCRNLLAIIVVLGCSRLEHRAQEAQTQSCAKLEFFEEYERMGLAKRSSSGALRLELPFDLHEASCAAPDSYGHRTTLLVELISGANECRIRSATGDSQAFGEDVGENGPWRDAFMAIDDPNLADHALQQIELRDARTRHALLLLRRSYWFYEHVAPGSPLKPEQEPEGASDCCYGYTSSAFPRRTEEG